MTAKPNMQLRWATLIVVLLNILFNYIYTTVMSSRSIGEITSSIPDLFAPPAYVFLIWGLIYLSFLIFCLLQLLPVNLHEPSFEKLSRPLIAANVLCSFWIVVFTQQLLGLSVIVIGITLIVAGYQFVIANREEHQHELNQLFAFPFSLFFGWLSVAAIANTSLWLASNGWILQDSAGALATKMMIAIAAIAGILIGISYRSLIYPAVIIWATIGIAIARRIAYHDISKAAIYAALVCVLVLLVNIIRYFRR